MPSLCQVMGEMSLGSYIYRGYLACGRCSVVPTLIGSSLAAQAPRALAFPGAASLSAVPAGRTCHEPAHSSCS